MYGHISLHRAFKRQNVQKRGLIVSVAIAIVMYGKIVVLLVCFTLVFMFNFFFVPLAFAKIYELNKSVNGFYVMYGNLSDSGASICKYTQKNMITVIISI